MSSRGERSITIGGGPVPIAYKNAGLVEFDGRLKSVEGGGTFVEELRAKAAKNLPR